MTTDDLLCCLICAAIVGVVGFAFFGTLWGLPVGALIGGWLNA